MEVLNEIVLRECCARHADSEKALLAWLSEAKKAQWRSLHDIKQMYRSTDGVGSNRYVFNIRGNNYRLVAIINFMLKKVVIRFAGNHAEYDKIDAESV